jgi:predicted alpha-1,2-mannosidase
MKTKAFRVTFIAVTVLCICVNCAAEETRVADLVDPFIGTGFHGHTYPGASLPFGMVQLGPDTRLTGWDGCSAYHYSDSVVYGFSHTHLSGTGCSDYGDILLMPTAGHVQLIRGFPENTASGYCSRFRHERESASPGFYGVHLDDYDIDVELTVTKRCGMHRYTFPKSDAANVILDLEHRDEVISSCMRIVSDTEIEGFRRSRAWAKDQHIYFVARFSKPFQRSGVATDDEIVEGAREAAGKNIKAFVTFETKKDEAVIVTIGISAVDIEGARKNLDSEIPGWDFESVRDAADDEWCRALGKIRIAGGTREQRIVFYTALYHALLAPNLFMDADGRYRGRDLEIHHAEGFTNYTVFSLWDTYRAAHPLFTIIEPERTVDFIETFITQYEQGGLLPIWELAANETGCMIGYHSVPVIADAYVKGIRGFDAGKAYQAMKHSAEQDWLGLEHYRAKGYIPGDSEGGSVSKTLEYAYDDWCIAQMAKALGRDEDYAHYISRAQSYKNVFDPSTGFMRAKMNERWFAPFDPREVNFNYTEANAWQYSFYVPQDVKGLMELMGGRERFAKKLDELFSTGSAVTGIGQPDVTGLIGQYAHGNEPSHHMAYLYCYAGRPWKTQQRASEIMDVMYTARSDGLCGNEDCGQMSAWYVLSAMGFYPVTPGSDIYVIGSPLFENAAVDLGGGKRFVIRGDGVSKENVYIQSASLNGKPYTHSYLKHADIVSGGELVFKMGPEPNKSWGSGDGDIPRSAINDHLILPVPYVATEERVFTDSIEVTLASITEGAGIFYTLDGASPSRSSTRYTEPFVVKETATVTAVAVKDGCPNSHTISAEFIKIPAGRSITLHTSYSPMYAGGGDLALIDHIYGPENFRTGQWQGYQGVGIDAVIDLGGVRTVRKISTGFLQDQGAWVFLPTAVSYEVSTDGKTFETIAELNNEIPPDSGGVFITRFTKDGLQLDTRYVRVRAANIGVCPAWHRGAGQKAWVFADEIVIE